MNAADPFDWCNHPDVVQAPQLSETFGHPEMDYRICRRCLQITERVGRVLATNNPIHPDYRKGQDVIETAHPDRERYRESIRLAGERKKREKREEVA